MKQLAKQKWILSSLLIAALGSQYYFSISSKNSGLIEMSELAATEQSIIEIAAALERSRPPAPVPVVAAVPIADVSGRQSRTEGVNPVAPCSDCVTLTKAEATRIRQILVEITGKKVAAKADSEVPETAVEKMRREREEREDKRREDKLAKDEKAREKLLVQAEKKKDEQELRDERFRSDFDRMSSRCSDVACYSSSLSSALNRYSDKSRMISSKVVNEIFVAHIAKDLKEGLKDPDNSKATEALETLMADVPMTYKNLKNNSIDLARAVAATKATDANASFKQAETLRKANKLNESNTAFLHATEQKAEFVKMVGSHETAISDGTERAEDKATMSYYKTSYQKSATRWLADIMNSSNFTIDSTSGVVDANTNGTGRGVVRGGNGNTAVGNPLINNSNLTAPNTNSTQFGTQQNQGLRGGRTN